MPRALILAALLAAPAGAEVCATIEAAGRPLPRGTATIKREGGKSMLVPVVDGRFCAAIPEAEWRQVDVSPMDFTWPSLDFPEGAPTLHLDGLTYPAASAGGTARIELSLKGETGVRAFVVARVTMGRDRFSFDWCEVGERCVLDVQPGRLNGLHVWAPPLAVASVSPPLWSFSEGTPKMVMGEPLKLDVVLKRGGSVSGRVRLQGGEPFAPVPDVDGEGSRFWLRFETLTGDFQQVASVGPDGSFSLPAVLPGLRLVIPNHGGSGFRWNPGTARLIRVTPKGLKVDWKLEDAGWLKVDLEGVEYEAGAERRVIGIASGTAPGLIPFLLNTNYDPSFAFLLSPEGNWFPMAWTGGKAKSASAPVPTGDYATYLIRKTDPMTAPSVLVLGIGHRGNKAGTKSSIHFKTWKPGKASISGRLRGGRPDARALESARTRSELHAAMQARVDVFDAVGKYAGTAFAVLGEEILRTVGHSLDREEPGQAAVSVPEEAAYRLEGLRPGRYSLRPALGSRAGKEVEVTLGEGETLVRDLDVGGGK